MSLLKLLKSGTNIRKKTTFPGTDKEFEFRLLTEQDKFESNFAADLLYKDHQIAFHNVGDYQNEKTNQMLFRACVESGTDIPIAQDMSEFRKYITGPERDILVDEYTAFDKECNPSPSNLTEAEFDKLLFEVKKNAAMTIGNCTSLHTLRRLSLYLASQPLPSPTDSGFTSV